jgi:ribosomal protein L14E/L6E/L27E
LNDDGVKITHSDVSKNYWRHRKNLRRRPPTPPTTTSTEGNPVDEVTVDLRQRILDILSTSNNEDCERELSKLKKELDNRSRRSAMVAVASSATTSLNDASALSTSADESRLTTRRKSSGGARRRRHRAAMAEPGNF